MNKLEESFWREYLALRYEKARPQGVKFRLGNGIVYTPDFVDLSVQPVKAWEVKGPKAFRGGFENLKVAAALYPEVRWVLVWAGYFGLWVSAALALVTDVRDVASDVSGVAV